jgi:hypothetical protein
MAEPQIKDLGRKSSASIASHKPVSVIAIALPEMIRDLVESTLLPLFGLRKPERATISVQCRTLSANRFLAANLHQPVHASHSLGGVKPIGSGSLTNFIPSVSAPTKKAVAFRACEVGSRSAAQK